MIHQVRASPEMRIRQKRLYQRTGHRLCATRVPGVVIDAGPLRWEWGGGLAPLKQDTLWE